MESESPYEKYIGFLLLAGVIVLAFDISRYALGEPIVARVNEIEQTSSGKYVDYDCLITIEGVNQGDPFAYDCVAPGGLPPKKGEEITLRDTSLLGYSDFVHEGWKNAFSLSWLALLLGVPLTIVIKALEIKSWKSR